MPKTETKDPQQHISTKELLERRGELMCESRDLIEKRGKKEGDFTETDRERHKALLGEIADVNEQIEMANEHNQRFNLPDPSNPTVQTNEKLLKRLEAAGMTLAEHAKGTDGANSLPTFRDGSGVPNRYQPLKQVSDDDSWRHEMAYRQAYADGIVRTLDDDRGHKAHTIQAHRAACGDSGGPGPGSYGDGGFLTTPLQYVSEMIKCCDKTVMMRQMARIFTVTDACALGARKRTKGISSATWGQSCRKPECDTPEGTVKTLHPHCLAACTAMCRELIRLSVVDPVMFFLEELSRNMAETMEQAYLFGTGQNEPFGMLAEDAVSADRYLPFSLAADTLDGDMLIDMLCSIPDCMLNGNLLWMMSRELWCSILKLKTSSGYLWSTEGNRGLTPGADRQLLGIPVAVSEFMQDGSAEGHVPLALFDAQQYWIADRNSLLTESETCVGEDMVYWYSRFWTDGMPICDEGFSFLKIVA